MVGKLQRIGAIAWLVAAAVIFCNSPLYGAIKLVLRLNDPVALVNYRMASLGLQDYEAAIRQAIAEEDFADAANLVEMAEEHGTPVSAELASEAVEPYISMTLRYSRDFTMGVLSGEVSTIPAFMGSMVADLAIFGDMRDLSVEGYKAVSSQDYDSVTLALAIFGVASTVGGPADLIVSAVKSVKKAGKLSGGLTRLLSSSLGDAIDISALKRSLSGTGPMFQLPDASGVVALTGRIVSSGGIDRFDEITEAARKLLPVDVVAIRSRFSGILKRQAVDDIGELANAVAGVSVAGGISATRKALEIADSPDDLRRLGKVAVAEGKRTSSVLRLLGRSAIRLADLVRLMIGSVVAFILWFFGLMWTVVGLVRNLRAAVA